MQTSTDHSWPSDPAAHVWGPWMAKTARDGKNPPTQYRQCVHPQCGGSETREAPTG